MTYVNRNDLLDRVTVCRLFGGSRPIDASTLYRGIREGRYPKPVSIGPNSRRWLRSECQAVLNQMVEGR
jgi:predicted DNA-binding transcriptional regulator AlpA